MKSFDIRKMPEGGITSPEGFSAGATSAGIKKSHAGALDLAMLYSIKPCSSAGLFTRNLVKAAPVLLSKERAESGSAQALIVNSGCANACMGTEGERDAREMAYLAAKRLGIPERRVMVASTGVIGQRLPMDKVNSGIKNIRLSPEGGHSLAEAIMTTDTFPKEAAFKITIEDATFSLGGAAKGAGMIHPDMATMLCFLTTDASIEVPLLKECLKQAVSSSFNMITIDGDTSPNDMVVILANGKSDRKKILKNTTEAFAFSMALTSACQFLSKEIARDGEGATRLIEVQVEGARNKLDARKAARTVAGSNLVKAAVHGADPNWGRIIAALGRSGAHFQPSQVGLYLGELCLMKEGKPQGFVRVEAENKLKAKEVIIRIKLNEGPGIATAWGCDLSEEYVTINSAYTT